MSDIIDRSQVLELPCGKCGYEFQETIARLESNPDLTCPKCGTVNNFDFNDVAAKLKEMEESIRKIRDIKF